MEDKKINEQESLELITRMIQQTKKDSVIGSGNMFLMWGYLNVFFSLAVAAMTYIRQEGGWGWLFMAIPIIGFITAGIMARRMKKINKAPSTYTTKSIGSIWGCMSVIFGIYAVFCIFKYDEPRLWTGMFFLGLLLPAIGTYCTGTILKENRLQHLSTIGMAIALAFLGALCTKDPVITIDWVLIMAVCMIVNLVIPGHILNYKAKKANKEQLA